VSSASGAALGAVRRNLIKSCASGLACSLLEEVGCGFYHSNFFGDRCRDPLV
jgi:hypothetical protein